MNSKDRNIEILEPKNQLNLFGFNDYFNFFIEIFKKKKLPHAIMLNGAKGLGKATFVYHFLNYVLSTNEEKKYSINKFNINNENISFNLLINQTHPNFFLIENKKFEKEIKIEQIRNLHQFLYKSTYSKDLKIVMIDNAESLNLNSSNALLKALEEPNDNTFFFIIHDSSHKISETIRSRCLEFKIFFSNNEKKNIFQNLVDQYNFKINYSEIIQNLSFDTPGNLLKYLLILYNANISINEDKLSIIYYFIDKFKTEKDPKKLPLISFLIEKFYNELILSGDTDLNETTSNYKNILNLLNDMKKFSLDEKNILISIKDILKNEAR